MAKFIDAVGKACPQPVIMAKRAYDEGNTELVLAVDNAAAVENLKRLGENLGAEVAVTQNGNIYQVRIDGTKEVMHTKDTDVVHPKEMATKMRSDDYAVFIGKDFVGDGDRNLGKKLMTMLIYSLANSDNMPAHILFMNGGVMIPTCDDAQLIENLEKLSRCGCEILVCGTCLDFYRLTDQLRIGRISNMYEILSRMQESGKVITV